MRNLIALDFKLMLITSFFTFISLGLFAQRSVSGVVTDGSGDPLIGASVLVKDTNNGTITDIDGSFNLNVPNDAQMLQVSYTGYTTQDIDITGQSSVNISLAEDAEILDEVVVIGYGRQKKSVVTGAVGKVEVEELVTRSPGQLQAAVQGKVAGIAITPTSGAPDAGFKVRIRGTGSNGPSEPLYIVDGMRTRDISFIEAVNISSFEVLKDAAAASIYGAEGANGVVLITTKNGEGASGGYYSTQFGQQMYRGDTELLNSTQWKSYLQEAGVAGAEDIDDSISTDWLDVLFQNAPLQRHNLGFDGSTDNLSYHFGVNYFDQAGIIGGADKSNFRRLSGNVGLKADVAKWLEVGTNFTYSNTRAVGGAFGDISTGGIISNALLMDPSAPEVYTGNTPVPQFVQDLDQSTLLRDDDGNVFGLSQTTNGEILNPSLTLALINGDGNRSNSLFGSTYATFKLTEGLSFTSRFGIDNANGINHNWTPAYFANPTSQQASPTSAYSFFSRTAYQWENFASYDVSLSSNTSLGLLAGTSIWNSEVGFLNGNASGLIAPSTELSYIDGSESTNGVLGGNSQQRLLSQFGRATLNISDKYLFMASLRRDGTSLFRDENRFNIYPGVSAGWVISREDFFNSSGVFNFAKLRASWGQAGSLSSVFPGAGRELLQALFTYNGQTAIDPATLSNEALTWETSEQTNIGLDLGFLNDAFTLSVDYFNKETKDLLTPSTPPNFVGNAGPLVNAGTIRNSGVEFELLYKNRDNDLKYQISANLTTLKNEVTNLNGNDLLQGSQQVGVSYRPTVFEVGQPAWYFTGYQTDGLNADGSANIIDNNGDGEITPDDYGFIGSPHPDLIYGGAINLEYKGFDLTVFAQGVAGNEILLGWSRTDRAQGNKISTFTDDDFFAPNVDGNVYFSDFMVFSGSFLRIKQIQLGYDLGEILNGGLTNLRFYASLDDFFTFTKYPGLDPEIGSTFDDAIGIDRGTYPIPGRIVVGFSTNF